jgi:hypothetical protein
MRPKPQPEWDLEFGEWMKQVDIILLQKVGVDSSGLPDYAYAAAFDAEDTPSRAASDAIRNAREY